MNNIISKKTGKIKNIENNRIIIDIYGTIFRQTLLGLM